MNSIIKRTNHMEQQWHSQCDTMRFTRRFNKEENGKAQVHGGTETI